MVKKNIKTFQLDMTELMQSHLEDIEYSKKIDSKAPMNAEQKRAFVQHYKKVRENLEGNLYNQLLSEALINEGIKTRGGTKIFSFPELSLSYWIMPFHRDALDLMIVDDRKHTINSVNLIGNTLNLITQFARDKSISSKTLIKSAPLLDSLGYNTISETHQRKLIKTKEKEKTIEGKVLFTNYFGVQVNEDWLHLISLISFTQENTPSTVTKQKFPHDLCVAIDKYITKSIEIEKKGGE